MIRISDRDLQILRILEKNARMPFTEIARRLGVSEATVRKRVSVLEKAGVIKGYRAVLDPKKIGYNVVAIIGFDASPEQYMNIIKKVEARREVKVFWVTVGDHMGISLCWFKDKSDFQKFVEWLECEKGVTRVCPAMVLEENLP